MPVLPPLALSVRQPWAWAIIHAGKDVENRSAAAIRNMPALADLPLRVAIHAAKGLTREEYERARDFMYDVGGVTCPPPQLLLRGGIIGSVSVTGVVATSDSFWWMGPRGLKLIHPEPCTFRPVVGALGLFKWTDASYDIVPPAAKWMLQTAPKVEPKREHEQAELI